MKKLLHASAISLVMCAACASHHAASPQDRLTANLQELQEAVTINVGDGQRAARLKTSVDELGQQLRSFEALRKTFQSDFLALNSRPDGTRGEFESLIDRFAKQGTEIRARVFELHFEMISATTDKEWKTLSYYERKVLTDPET
jgi:septal ring factor EnvC (AmiA/AmiB activator)